MSSVSITVNESANFDKLLAEVPILIREQGLKKALGKTLRVVRDKAKQLAPVGRARTGRKADKKHLRATITSAIRDYGAVKVGVVGAAYPAGAHAHLVEFGHDVVRNGKVVGRAAPRPFMRPAVEQTKTEQHAAFVNELTRFAAEVS